MSRLQRLWDSSVGKKAVMAVTGLIGVLYVIGHMVGNLQIFQGSERINAYGRMLHGPLNELLWAVRVVLVLAVVLHVVAAWQLTMRDRAARPVAYARRVPQVSTLASRTMRWGGVLLLVFIVVHILHFTTGTIRPAGVFAEGDVYGNVARHSGFRGYPRSTSYRWWPSACTCITERGAPCGRSAPRSPRRSRSGAAWRS